jgi:hypothetical protein
MGKDICEYHYVPLHREYLRRWSESPAGQGSKGNKWQIKNLK